MKLTVYRGATKVSGAPVLEKITWRRDDDHDDAVSIPGQTGGWVFETGDNILSTMTVIPAVHDAFGTLLDPGGLVTPIDPYEAPLIAGYTQLSLLEYVTAHNLWAVDDITLEPIDTGALGGLVFLDPPLIG